MRFARDHVCTGVGGGLRLLDLDTLAREPPSPATLEPPFVRERLVMMLYADAARSLFLALRTTGVYRRPARPCVANGLVSLARPPPPNTFRLFSVAARFTPVVVCLCRGEADERPRESCSLPVIRGLRSADDDALLPVLSLPTTLGADVSMRGGDLADADETCVPA